MVAMFKRLLVRIAKRGGYIVRPAAEHHAQERALQLATDAAAAEFAARVRAENLLAEAEIAARVRAENLAAEYELRRADLERQLSAELVRSIDRRLDDFPDSPLESLFVEYDLSALAQIVKLRRLTHNGDASPVEATLAGSSAPTPAHPS
jgi:hypothetical protein